MVVAVVVAVVVEVVVEDEAAVVEEELDDVTGTHNLSPGKMPDSQDGLFARKSFH